MRKIENIAATDTVFHIGSDVFVLTPDELASVRDQFKVTGRGKTGSEYVTQWIDAGCKITATSTASTTGRIPTDVYAAVAVRKRTKSGLSARTTDVRVQWSHMVAVRGEGKRGAPAADDIAAATLLAVDPDDRDKIVPVSYTLTDGGQGERDVQVDTDGNVVVGEWTRKSATKLAAEREAAAKDAKLARLAALLADAGIDAGDIA